MAEESTARVDLRHHTLADGAEFVAGDGPNGAQGFIAVAEPPPVGSVVHLYPGPRALAITEVAESVDGDRGTGIYVRDATAEDEERHERIGTERMGPSDVDPSSGDGESDNVLPQEAAPADIGAPAAEAPPEAPPEPAPEPAPTPQAEAASEPEPAEPAAAAPADSPDPETAPDDGKGSGRGGKKRKGRRRS
jgi:hypothetical protein